MFFPNGPTEELKIYGYVCMQDDETWLLLHIACKITIRTGSYEGPELTKLAKQAAAQLPRSSRLKGKHSFPRLL